MNKDTFCDLEIKRNSKKNQRQAEEELLRDMQSDLDQGKEARWEELADRWAGDPDRDPTPQQKTAFLEKLDREAERIRAEKCRDEEEALVCAAQNGTDPTNCETIPRIPTTDHRKPKCCRNLRRIVAVAAVAVILITGSTMYFTVDAFAAGVNRIIAKMIPDDGAEELRIEDKKGDGVEMDWSQFVGLYVPNWIPKGYRISEIKLEGMYKKIIYINEDQSIICYEIAKKSYSLFMDDDAVEETDIFLHDVQGKIIITQNTVCVVWESENHFYSVSGEKGLRDELVKMAEQSVKLEAES